MTSKGHALSRDALIRTLTAYSGITTSDGAFDGTATLIDSNLKGRNDFISEKTILILSGDAKDEDKGATAFDTSDGKITLQGTGFSHQIKAGTIFRVLNISTTEIDVANINSKIGTNTDPAGKTTLFAWLLKLFEHGGQGLVYYGEVTQVNLDTQFRVAGLAGFGDAYFADTYRVFVVRDAAGLGAAPQGEMQPCTAYTSVGGIFTQPAFTAGLGVGDEVLLLHERIAEIADLVAALGNPTADMRAVTQSEAASLAAYQVLFKEHFRAHDQTRICLVVPSLANLALDFPNTAIRAELEKIGTVSVLDQLGVGGGQEDWDVYDLVVVGSDAGGYTFTVGNIDDLILFHGPIMVCNSVVAAHLKMGADTAGSSANTVNEWCKSIYNRVMFLVFGSTGDKEIFSENTVSDRLDMSAAALTVQLLMTSLTGDTNTTAVVGWLPSESADAETYELNDGSTIPSGRLFAGCFVHADKLTDLGTLLLRRLARNLTQGHLHPLLVNVKRAYQEAIPDTDVPDTATVTETDCVLLELGPQVSRRYCLRNLRLKAQVDPATNTMTVRLYECLEGSLVEVDSFEIDTANWATYHSLMDMFAVPEVHSDSIKVTCQMDAGTLAVKATYSYAEAKK